MHIFRIIINTFLRLFGKPTLYETALIDERISGAHRVSVPDARRVEIQRVVGLHESVGGESPSIISIMDTGSDMELSSIREMRMATFSRSYHRYAGGTLAIHCHSEVGGDAVKSNPAIEAYWLKNGTLYAASDAAWERTPQVPMILGRECDLSGIESILKKESARFSR